MVSGTNMAYVAGDGHRPIPMADDLLYRRAHAPQEKKPAGLDWAAMTPRCKACGEKSGQLNNDDTCPTCASPAPPPAPPVKKAAAPKPKGRPRKVADAAEVVRLYVDETRTVPQVAETLGCSVPTIRRALKTAEVELRDDRKTNDPAAGHRARVNTMTALKARIDALGTTSREIKEWAVREGLLLEMQLGVPPARLVAEYAAAHDLTEGAA